MPRVSVILPVYNSAAYVSKAINSVLSQTFTDFDLIVVDDGSTDNTGEVVARIADSRVQYLKKNNQGPSLARNMGIRNSIGEFVAFIDSDDCWLPNKLELQVRALNLSPEAGLVHSSVLIVSPENKLLRYDRAWLEGRVLYKLLLNNAIATSSVMVRRKVLEDVGLFAPDSGSRLIPKEEHDLSRNTMRRGEDWELWMRISSEYPIVVEPNASVIYTARPGGLSKNILAMRDDTLYSMHVAYSSYAAKYRHLQQFSYSNIHLNAGKGLCTYGELASARQEFMRAIRLCPFRLLPYIWLLSTFLGKYLNRRARNLRNFFSVLFSRSSIPGGTSLR